MKRKPRCTQAEIQRAVKGARAAGMSVGRVEIDPNGTIVIMLGQPGQIPSDTYQAWKAGRNAPTG